jgi:two-component system, chemotaxis family, sensor kinase CheA
VTLSLQDEALKDFLVESHEGLDQIDREFVELEADPSARYRLAAIFRAIHTIKGTSGFFGFSKLEGLTHVGESLLSRLREGTLLLTPEITSALLMMADKTRRILRAIELDGTQGDDRLDDLIAHLAALAKGTATPPGAQPAVPSSPAAPSRAAAPSTPPPSAPTPSTAAETRPPTSPLPVVPARAQTPSTPTPAARGEIEPARPDGQAGPAVSDSSIRVDVGLLDKLMNLVGELVLARNQILQSGAKVEDPAFVAASQRLNLITTELQEGVMKTRMQPIGNLWNKLPRIVRDLAVSCGKQVRIEMSGKETDLDRTILEAIKDPITHMVRNSVDHGIEDPAVRAARGKPRTGTLSLRAFHEGGQVNIEISDDGAGLDGEAIRKKALQLGLVSPERAARLSERELTQLIFLPAFSTAARVTNVSGRGVGMDVVKTNIEKIGGTVDLHSTVGVGTTFRIKIPLTLAIIPALIVTSGGDRYAIPQVNLLELVRLEGAQARTGVETIHGFPVYRLRGNLLPLVYLDQVLELGAGPAAPSADDTSVNIVVLQADDRQFGLVVEGINDSEEIVVKPLGKDLKILSCFAGATIMGDGRVALILDVPGVAERTGLVSGVRDRALHEPSEAAAVVREEKQTLLLFRVGDGASMAIPLSMVARLEEFACSQIERAGRQDVVQYRGEIMPLVDLSAVVHGAPRADSDPIQVVVYSADGRSVGLVVERIVDIVEEAIGQPAAAGGLSTAVVIQGRVTDLLDVHGVIRSHDPSLLEAIGA